MNGILLDTHVWIWYALGSAELKKESRVKIEAACKENKIYLSAISLWEISMLEKKQRIKFEMPSLEWIDQSIELMPLIVLPLTPAIAADSCSLPGDFHADPADCMIVATARVERLTLLTRDEKMLAYAKKKYLSSISV